MRKTLILGVGNEILGDDGIGPKLVRDMSEAFDDPDIEFSNACCGGIDIIEAIRDFKQVILIDAIRTRDGKPGDVFYFQPSGFRETMNLSGLHDISFLTALKLSHELKMDITDDLHIIGIEIIEDRLFTDKLTREMEELYPSILDKTLSLVRQITGIGNPVR